MASVRWKQNEGLGDGVDGNGFPGCDEEKTRYGEYCGIGRAITEANNQRGGVSACTS